MSTRQSTKERVLDYIDTKREGIVAFLSEIIQFKSVNPGTPNKGKEQKVQNWIREKLEGFGFDKIDYWAVDPEKKRPNVVATIKGKGDGKPLILNGHCDVVPVTEQESQKWAVDPWKGIVKNGFVYGRGASDMKGGLTAIIWAAKALVDNGIAPAGDLYIESVVGEESQEGETIGTRATVDRGYVAPFALVAEPTNCEILVKSPGLFFFELLIKGKETHAANRNQVIFPQRYGIPCGKEVGVDAIQKATLFVDLFQRLEVQLNQRWRDRILGGGGYPYPMDGQGIGIFTINPSFIQGGTYLGAVPGYCKITYCVWHPDWLEDEEVWKELKKHVEALASTDDWLRENPPEFKVPVLQNWKPMKEVPIDSKNIRVLTDICKKIFEKEPIISGMKGVADSTFLSRQGIPTVVFGPSGINCGVHGPNERVSIDQVVNCTKVYALLAMGESR